MAFPIDLNPASLDVTRGLRTGFEIGQRRGQRKREESAEARRVAQEARAAEAFDIEKEQVAIDRARQEEADERELEDRKIERLEGMWEVANKVGNQQAKDELRNEIASITGFHIAADDEELGTLLSDRRAAVKAGDQAAVDSIDSYLISVRSMTPEQAARAANIPSEVEQFVAERKFGRKLEEEEQAFEAAEERRKGLQAETRKATGEAIAGVEGLDETTKALLPLISSGEVSGAVLNTIAAQTGVTFRENIAGTGTIKGKENLKGKKVTGVFDKAGKLVDEFEAAPTVGRREIVQQENPITGEITFKGVMWSEDVNGNPILKVFTPQEDVPEGAAPEKGETPKKELLESSFTFEEYKASIPGAEQFEDKDLRVEYNKLVNQGALIKPGKEKKKEKEEKGFTSEERIRERKKGKGLIEKMSEGFKGIIGPQRIKKEAEAEEPVSKFTEGRMIQIKKEAEAVKPKGISGPPASKVLSEEELKILEELESMDLISIKNKKG
jgi:hypothetical protein